MSYKGVPTIRKRLIGGRLRRLREERGVSVDEVAKSLGVGPSTIRRQESGHTAVSVADARAYADIYGVEDAELRDRLETLAKHGRYRGWWADFGSKVGPTAVDVADAEDLATEIRSFQPLVVPGVFQTRAYSSALIEVGATLHGAEVGSRADLIAVRERRKLILERDAPPQVWCVVGEAALLTRVGGPEVMSEQVRHLLELSTRPNIRIQLLPFSAGAHLGMAGGFMVFTFDNSLDGSILYVERVGGGAFNDSPPVVGTSSARFSHLQAQSLSVDETRRYLQQVILNEAS